MNNEDLLKLNYVVSEILKEHTSDTVFKKIIEEEIVEKLEAGIKSYNKRITQIGRLYCLTDAKTKEILFDKNGNMKYTIENQDKLEDAVEEFQKREIKFEKSKITRANFPEKLSYYQKKVLAHAIEIVEEKDQKDKEDQEDKKEEIGINSYSEVTDSYSEVKE